MKPLTRLAAAALAIAGLRGRVCETAFFVETADGVFSGPHAVVTGATLDRAHAVLTGKLAPVCPEHQHP